MKKVVLFLLITVFAIGSLLMFHLVGPLTPKTEAIWGTVACITWCYAEAGWCDDYMMSTCFLDCYNWNC